VPISLGLAASPSLSLDLTGGKSRLLSHCCGRCSLPLLCLLFLLSPKKASHHHRVVSQFVGLILCHNSSVQAVSNLDELLTQSNDLLTHYSSAKAFCMANLEA